MAAPLNYHDFFSDRDRDPMGSGPEQKEVIQRVYHDWRFAPGPLGNGDLLHKVHNLFESEAVGGLGLFVTDSAGTPPAAHNPWD